MRRRLLSVLIPCLLTGLVAGCNRASEQTPPASVAAAASTAAPAPPSASAYVNQHLGDYVSVPL